MFEPILHDDVRAEQPSELELPGEPPACLQQAWRQMNPPQREAVLSCLDPATVSTENLWVWLQSYGLRVNYIGLDKYRNSLKQ
jgi:hypothetical protein